MKTNATKKIMVYLILGVVNTLNFFDLLLGEAFETAVLLSGKIASFFVALGFFAFLSLSFKTGYLKNVAYGYFTSVDSVYSYSQVLGTTTIKKDIPYLIQKKQVPETTAKSVLIVDKASKKTLYEKNSKLRLAPASTTKLMTALVALDLYSLSDTVTITKECFDVESTKVGFPVGSVYEVKDLLHALLISSAGDAACALSQSKITQDEFVFRMNQKALELGMHSTFFTNPIGLDGENNSHFSTASDLFVLASAAMKNNLISQIVKTKDYTIKSVDDSFIGKIETTNKMLYEVPQTIGVKTGKTTEAGEVLIYEYKDDLKDFVIIVMGSEDRFSDVRALLNWLLVSYAWR